MNPFHCHVNVAFAVFRYAVRFILRAPCYLPA